MPILELRKPCPGEQVHLLMEMEMEMERDRRCWDCTAGVLSSPAVGWWGEGTVPACRGAELSRAPLGVGGWAEWAHGGRGRWRQG